MRVNVSKGGLQQARLGSEFENAPIGLKFNKNDHDDDVNIDLDYFQGHLERSTWVRFLKMLQLCSNLAGTILKISYIDFGYF